MKRWLGVFSLLVLVGGFSVYGQENPWQGLTEEQVQKLKQGEIIILHQEKEGKEGERLIKAVMILNQSIDEVFNFLCQTERQEEYLPRLERSILIEEDENGNITEFRIKALFINIIYRVRHHYDPKHYRLYWELDPNFDNDIKHLEGYYQLYKINEHQTLARYATVVILSDLIPRSIQELLTKKDLPQSLGAVKKWIDSGGKYNKPEYKGVKKQSES